MKKIAIIAGSALLLTGCITVKPDTPAPTTPEPTVTAPTTPRYTPEPEVVTEDDEFIEAMSNLGYTGISNDTIEFAQTICDSLDEFGINDTVTYLFDGLTSKEEDKMSALIAASVVAYCPKYKSAFS